MRSRPFSRTSGSGLAAIALATVLAFGCSSPTTPGTPIGLMCPATVTAQSPDGQPTTVAFTGISTTGGSAPVTITCTPPDGSRFAVGTTPVSCTATDSSHQNAACNFTVTVSLPPTLLVTRFVAFGDSMTRGDDGRNSALASMPLTAAIQPELQLPDAQTYPGVLRQLLTTRYTRQTPTVANAGQGGEMLSESSTLTRFSIFTANFDAVLLMEGSNDVNAMDKDLAVEPVAIGNLQQMVHDAKNRGLRVLLATIPPMNPSASATARNQGARLVPEFNDRIRGVAAAENVPLVDVYTALNTDVATFIGNVDGLHPTPAGYARIAATFLTAIEQNLEVTSGPVSIVRARR